MVDTRRRYPFFFYSWGRGKRVDLTIPIEEGLQYRLGRFVIRGNKLFTAKQLAPDPAAKPGDLFSSSQGSEGDRELHQALWPIRLHQFHRLSGHRAR